MSSQDLLTAALKLLLELAQQRVHLYQICDEGMYRVSRYYMSRRKRWQ
jgi:hypothetical protein